MKKILQAFDGASAKKPVEGSNSMKKFLSIVSEASTDIVKSVDEAKVKLPKETGAEKAYRKQTGKTVDQRIGELDKVQQELERQKQEYIKQGIIKAENIEKTFENLSILDYFNLIDSKRKIKEAHGNSKIYDKCWTGYKKVPGKKRGEKGSCVKK